MHRPQEGAPGFIVKDDDDGRVWKRFAPFAILTPGQQCLAFALQQQCQTGGPQDKSDVPDSFCGPRRVSFVVVLGMAEFIFSFTFNIMS